MCYLTAVCIKLSQYQHCLGRSFSLKLFSFGLIFPSKQSYLDLPDSIISSCLQVKSKTKLRQAFKTFWGTFFHDAKPTSSFPAEKGSSLSQIHAVFTPICKHSVSFAWTSFLQQTPCVQRNAGFELMHERVLILALPLTCWVTFNKLLQLFEP